MQVSRAGQFAEVPICGGTQSRDLSANISVGQFGAQVLEGCSQTVHAFAYTVQGIGERAAVDSHRLAQILVGVTLELLQAAYGTLQVVRQTFTLPNRSLIPSSSAWPILSNSSLMVLTSPPTPG